MVRNNRVDNRRRENKPSPFDLELRSMPQSGKEGYFFPWNENIKGYDTISFNPVFSGLTISKQEVDTLIRELEKLPLYQANPFDPIIYAMIVIGIVTVILIFVLPSGENDSRGKDTMSTPQIIVLVVGILILCGLGYWVYVRGIKRRELRKHQITSVLDFQTNSVFNRRAKLSLSELGSYIMMKFDDSDMPKGVAPYPQVDFNSMNSGYQNNQLPPGFGQNYIGGGMAPGYAQSDFTLGMQHQNGHMNTFPVPGGFQGSSEKTPFGQNQAQF